MRLQQYYAHPRNAFWSIMTALLSLPAELDYPARVNALIKNRIALWDTLKSCMREGSLDSAIANQSIETNDFKSFFLEHPHIEAIFFNGRKSQQVFERRVLPHLTGRVRELPRLALPSTSPAMASMGRDQKIEAWREILGSLR